MNYKLVPVNETFSIPVPPDLTPAEEAELVERYKATTNMKDLEDEHRRLQELVETGGEEALDQIIAELEKELSDREINP